MDDDVLIFIVVGAVLFFMGITGLRNKQVYLGRVIRFIGPKMVMKGRIPVLIYGVGFCAGGALAFITGVAEMLNPQLEFLTTWKIASLILFVGGFIASVALEFFLYTSGMPPYDGADEVVEEEDSFRDILR